MEQPLSAERAAQLLQGLDASDKETQARCRSEAEAFFSSALSEARTPLGAQHFCRILDDLVKLAKRLDKVEDLRKLCQSANPGLRFSIATALMDIPTLLGLRHAADCQFGRTSISDRVDSYLYSNKERLIRPLLRELVVQESKREVNYQTCQLVRKELLSIMYGNLCSPVSAYYSAAKSNRFTVELQDLSDAFNESNLRILVKILGHSHVAVVTAASELILRANALPPPIAGSDIDAINALIKVLDRGDNFNQRVLNVRKEALLILSCLGAKTQERASVVLMALQDQTEAAPSGPTKVKLLKVLEGRIETDASVRSGFEQATTDSDFYVKQYAAKALAKASLA